MFTYPEFLLQHTNQRQAELRAEADRYRLVAAARWARKQRRATAKSGASAPASPLASAPDKAAGRHRGPAAVSDQVGTLAA